MKLQSKRFFGWRLKNVICEKKDGDWITAKLIRKMVAGVSVHSFVVRRGRDLAIFSAHQP